jgi:ribose transport system permease protein
MNKTKNGNNFRGWGYMANFKLTLKKERWQDHILAIDNLGILVIMLLFIGVVLIFSGPRFFNSSNITNLLRSVSVTGIVASALTLVMISGNIDLSVGWMIGFAACLTGANSSNAGAALFFALSL